MLLGKQLDDKVQNYVEALCNAGMPIGSSVIMAAGEGMIRAHDRTLLVQHGGRIEITKSWAMSLLKRMGYVKREATTKSTLVISCEDFKRVTKGFLKQIARMVKLRNIPDSLIINLDQTGVKLVPTDDWTMAAEGSKRVEVAGLGDKSQLHLQPLLMHFPANADSLSGKDILSTQFQMGLIFSTLPIIGPMKKLVFTFLRSSLGTSSKQEKTWMLHHAQKALVLLDNFSSQTTTSLIEKLEEQGIVVVMVPTGTTNL